MIKRITLPLTDDVIRTLAAGDEIVLSGTLYTARDQAHKRICDAIREKKRPPIPLKGSVLYYCGPTPAPPGAPIGSCGPTTSKRMDSFTPMLLAYGVKGMIGKGDRSKDVVAAIKRYGCIYFIAVGGAGAYLSRRVKKARVVAYKDLGPEAVYEILVQDLPVIVGVDRHGNNIYHKIRRI